MFFLSPKRRSLFWALSSASSGDPSMIGKDRTNWERFFRAININYDHVWQIPDYSWTLMFSPPIPKFDLSAGPIKNNLFMIGMSLSNRAPADERYYALKPATGEVKDPSRRFDFDFDAIVSLLRKKTKNKDAGAGWITGSCPLMWIYFNKIFEETGESFDLGEDSFIGFAGGWKTFKGLEVPKPQFRARMTEILNIPDKNIRDVYSFTETDVILGECEYHNLHVSPWGDIIIRDVETLEPVKTGEKGLVNIINPLANSYAGVSLLQDDIARIVMEDGCPCGRHGKVVEVFGRAEGAEAKGCGANIADMAGL
ncbi:hypothetical protein DRO91_06870 [Candidatus Heimdallarchaeota archaeon]|nr:MAG: hypothetical protein DRO63_06155 [Candidatus Gerdarchaeota archaeon]RLI70317.1 MAG: hypothetical protein DRO91_06870 [Candidatus Heimdallarchaeota archaeon]